MTCKVCGARATGEFCELHAEAYENIRRKYDAWKKASGVSWLQYLKEIQTNPYTGVWAKEVAQSLLSSSEQPEG